MWKFIIRLNKKINKNKILFLQLVGYLFVSLKVSNFINNKKWSIVYWFHSSTWDNLLLVWLGVYNQRSVSIKYKNILTTTYIKWMSNSFLINLFYFILTHVKLWKKKKTLSLSISISISLFRRVLYDGQFDWPIS